jgi:hypothetical protein
MPSRQSRRANRAGHEHQRILRSGQTGSAASTNILYQFKVDNDGTTSKARSFRSPSTATPARRHVRGPFTPTVTGAMMGVINFRLRPERRVQHQCGFGGSIQAFAGPRDDSFFLDLERLSASCRPGVPRPVPCLNPAHFPVAPRFGTPG